MAEKRFSLILSENGLNQSMNIIVDNVTGVNYFWARGTMGAGLSPLYNADGTIVVTKPEKKNDNLELSGNKKE